MTEEMCRANLLVIGKVQGVFFRASTMEQAQGLGLKGWVENLADGSVEIEVEGSRPSIESLESWCQHGPPDAEVEHVRIRWLAFQSEFQTFTIR